MAQAPRTTVTYDLDGSNRDFPIPFEYLARKFVQVTLVGVDRKVLTLNIDYRFSQRTIITLTKNWGPADGYKLIEIRRYTSATERLVDFSDGSILRAYDLNTSQVQSLHIAEEGRDIATDTIGVNNDGDLDARGRKIVNLADGTSDFDAVNLRQQKQWGGSALNQADRAEREANRSKSEADRATLRANDSSASAQKSESHMNASRVWAEDSAAKAVKSQASNAESYRHSQNSEKSAVEAAKQAGLATSNGAAQVQLATAQADRARDEATRSTQQANASAGSATTSKGHADRSKTEADRAKTEADKLGNMNALAEAIQSVVNPDFTLKQGWRFVADAIVTDRIRPRSGSDLNLFGNVTCESALTVRNTIQSDGAIRSNSEGSFGTTVRIRGAGSNAHLWFMDPQGVENALIYADPSGAMHMRAKSQGDTLTLNVDRSITVGTNISLPGEINAGTAIRGHQLLARDVVYAGGGAAHVASDGNLYGPLWGGYLSTWVNNQLGQRQPKYVFQSNAASFGGANGLQTQRINFHTPIANPVITVTHECGYGDGTQRAAWILNKDNNGFNVRFMGDARATSIIHWSASNPTNV